MNDRLKESIIIMVIFIVVIVVSVVAINTMPERKEPLTPPDNGTELILPYTELPTNVIRPYSSSSHSVTVVGAYVDSIGVAHEVYITLDSNEVIIRTHYVD